MLIGSWLSGAVVDHYAHALDTGVVEHNWRAIWIVSAACSAAVLVFFLLFFNEKDRPSLSQTSQELPALETPVA